MINNFFTHHMFKTIFYGQSQPLNRYWNNKTWLDKSSRFRCRLKRIYVILASLLKFWKTKKSMEMRKSEENFSRWVFALFSISVRVVLVSRSVCFISRFLHRSPWSFLLAGGPLGWLSANICRTRQCRYCSTGRFKPDFFHMKSSRLSCTIEICIVKMFSN